MTTNRTERFERLLAALEQELVAATDEEILAAAADLGMNPAMKGSAAFFGVTIGARPTFRTIDIGDVPDAADPRRRGKDDA